MGLVAATSFRQASSDLFSDHLAKDALGRRSTTELDPETLTGHRRAAYRGSDIASARRLPILTRCRPQLLTDIIDMTDPQPPCIDISGRWAFPHRKDD
jgi:hypothetical protein